MENTEKKVIEEENKKACFDNLRKVKDYIDSNVEELYEIRNNLLKSNIYIPDNKIPNVGLSRNNSILYISKMFKECGISMFVSTEPRSESDGDIWGISFIGAAIRSDVNEKVMMASSLLNQYKDILKKIESKRKNWIKKLNIKIKKYIKSLIESLGGSLVIMDVLNLEDEIEIYSLMERYKEIDNYIYNYDKNLKQNIVPAIVNEISRPSVDDKGEWRKHRHDMDAALRIFKYCCVFSDLEKLGFEDLIPVLQEKIIEAYKEEPNVVNFEAEVKRLYTPKVEGIKNLSRDNETTQKLEVGDFNNENPDDNEEPDR